MSPPDVGPVAGLLALEAEERNDTARARECSAAQWALCVAAALGALHTGDWAGVATYTDAARSWAVAS